MLASRKACLFVHYFCVAYLLLLTGIFACATSVIFIRMSATDPVLLSAYRLLLGGLVLLPFALHSHRDGWRGLLAGLRWRRLAPPALLLALHFITWIWGARLTPAANATLIVNMVPVAMPFLLYFGLRERLTRGELAGTGLAMLGVLAIGVNDLQVNLTHALGDTVCFLSMLFYASYLLYGRINRDLPSIYQYVVPVYLLAGLICLAIGGLMTLARPGGSWIGPDLAAEWIAIAGLALVPTVIGHSLINWSLKHLRGQAVAVTNLSQFIFAAIMAWLLLGEIPGLLFVGAATCVVWGALTVIRHAPTT
jgi:drug/metabolite transporter (DMT)-like permease